MEYVGWAGFFIGAGIFLGLCSISGALDDLAEAASEWGSQYERWVDAHLPPEEEEE